MDHQHIITWLQQRLTQPLPGSKAHGRMFPRIVPMPDEVPASARASAVLALLFPKDEELCLLFMKRTEDGRAHSGQISFPGGQQDPGDADLRATALREAQEEIGIMPADVDIIGALSPLYIPVSNFQVYPFIGYSDQPPVYNLSLSEVQHVLEIPLKDLTHPDTRTVTQIISPAAPEVKREVHAYVLKDNTIIWGATAMMLAELEMILEEYADLDGAENLTG